MSVDRPEQVLEEVTEFAVRHGGKRCFNGWERKDVRDYLEFHLSRGTGVFVRRQEAGGRGREVVGLGVGWQLNEREMRDEEFVKRPFRWQESNVRGDSFLFCDVVATERTALAVIAGEFQWRVPNWRGLKLFAIRRGRLVEYSGAKFLERMEGL